MSRRCILLAYNSFINATIPNNEIWYTSTDGNVVTPSATDIFGANIVSNTYADGKGTITFDGDVTEIGDYAFNYCSNLTSITIPDSVKTIGYTAFRNCTSLTSITIPDSVTTIGVDAFRECDSLTSITIPDSVTTIGDNAFWGCDSLANVTIPDSVTTIGYQAFYYCTSLTSVTIGDSVTTIGTRAFYYCTSLTSVYCKATTPPSLGGTWVFNNNNIGRKIYVPYQSLDAYKTAENWSNYAADIVGYDFENDTVVGGGSSLITFTVNGTEYQAEEGMTWGEWCNSSYNVINAVNEGTKISAPIANSKGYIYDSVSFSSVSPTQEIIVNHSYTLSDPTAGN